jgi:hypothetical protein
MFCPTFYKVYIRDVCLFYKKSVKSNFIVRLLVRLNKKPTMISSGFFEILYLVCIILRFLLKDNLDSHRVFQHLYQHMPSVI